MNETLNFVSALVEGFLLGAIFFAGLWWTVQEGPSSNRPALRFLGSLLLRTSCLSSWILFCFRWPLGKVVDVPTWVLYCALYCNETHQTSGERIESIDKGGKSCDLVLMS